MNDQFPPSVHVLYSPGIERFFGITTLDIFTTMEIAQILSSKIPSIVVFSIKDGQTPFFNDNCHEYTLKDKNVYKNSYEIQAPRYNKFLNVDDIEHVDEMPVDYHPQHNFKNWQMLIKLKKYVQFVISTWYAAKVCEVTHNILPEYRYADDYFNGLLPDNFIANIDTSMGTTKQGITAEIKKILYNCNLPREAVEQFNAMWENNNTVQTMYWRTNFYRMSNIDPQAVPLKPNLDQFVGWIM